MTEDRVPYGTPLSFADSPNHMASCFKRLHTAAGCTTQAELAKVLGVPARAVSDGVRRGTIPSGWLLTLLCKKWINPAWILTGLGPFYIEPDDYTRPKTSCPDQNLFEPNSFKPNQFKPDQVKPDAFTSDQPAPPPSFPLPKSLSTERLLAELVRRTMRELV